MSTVVKFRFSQNKKAAKIWQNIPVDLKFACTYTWITWFFLVFAIKTNGYRWTWNKIVPQFPLFYDFWVFFLKKQKNGKNPHCELFSSLPKIFFKSGCFIFMKAFWAAMWDIRWLIVTSWKLAILVFTYFVCQGIKVKFQAIVSTI